MLLLVRELSVPHYGQLALTVAIVAIFVAVADGGFSRLLVRDLARTGERGVADIWRILRLRLVSVLGVTALVAAVGLASGWAAIGYVALSSTFLIGEALSFGFESAAVGLERPWRFVVAQAIGAGVLLGGLCLLAALDATTLNSALATLAVAAFVRTLAHTAIWRSRQPVDDRPRPAVRDASELWKAALPFLALSVMTTVHYRFGIVVCYLLRGASETAPYAAAVRVLDVAGVLGAIAFSALAPVFSRAHQAGNAEVWRLWRRYVGMVAVVALPAGVTLAVAGDPLAGLLFGERYAASAGTDLSLLAPAAGIFMLLSVSSVVLYMDDRSGALLRLTALNLATSLILTVVLTAVGGHRGTAAAVSVGEIVSFIGFAYVIARRHRGETARATTRP